MLRSWASVGVAGALAFACGNKAGSPPSPSGSGSGSATAVAPPQGSAQALSAEGCLTAPDYLVPPQKYHDGDLIRAMLVDGDQVFFRNMDELMRVPLAGGQIVTVGKAPALSLRGTTELWFAGDDLVMQSPGEPIFMKAKKSGGAWTSFIDLTAAKKGGGRDVATRILQGFGKPAPPAASAAAFDGKAFYYAEVSYGKGRHAPASSKLESVSFGGGDPRVLFESPGEISEVTRAGDQIAFHLVLPPTAEQVKANEAERKKDKIAFGVSGENWLMSVPAAGGAGKRLMRIGSVFSGGLIGTTTMLGADGARLYVSGYADEDFTKPGIYRVDIASGSIKSLDKRFVRGKSYVVGDRVVVVGSGSLAAGTAAHGPLVLTGARDGNGLTLASCIADKLTLHASAVAGETVLLSLFQGSTGTAAIAKVPLR